MNVAQTIEAPSAAAFAHALAAIDHEVRLTVTATENGQPWASLHISPMTDTMRALFPVDLDGYRGDTRKRAHQGVMARRGETGPVMTVIERARRMA